MKRKSASLVFGVCVAIVLVIAIVIISRNPGHWMVMSRFAGSGNPISFFGKVVDQDGLPISGAAVSISIENFDPKSALATSGNHFEKRLISKITDSGGGFVIQGEFGSSLSIEKISQPGYVAMPEDDWTYEPYWKNLSFDYWHAQGHYLYVPDQQKPAIFPLRKIDEARRIGPSKGGTERLIP